jgi:hypothetical protein
MNLRVPQRLRNLLNVWANILFLTRTHVHWIRILFYSLYNLRMYVFRLNVTLLPFRLRAHRVASSILSSIFHYRYSELFRLTWVYEVLMENAWSRSSTLPTPLYNYTGKQFFLFWLECYMIYWIDFFLNFGPCIYLRWIKNQQMHSLFNVLVPNILLHASAL